MKKPSPKSPELNRLQAEARGLRLKDSYSQNFLVDEAVLQQIVDEVAPTKADHVVEIGPGAGFLTEKLLPRVGKLTAVELDPEMCQYLSKKFLGHPKFHLLAQDVLTVEWPALAQPEPVHVVGNLPYNITSSILFALCGEMDVVDFPVRQAWQRATLMVQKEVAERVTASAGSKAYNHLSIAVQVWYEASMAFTIPPTAFSPPPKVTSAVITLEPRPTPRVEPRLLPMMFRLVRAAFSQRRKTLRNVLLHQKIAPPDLLEAAFERAGVDASLRAEALSIETFGALSDALLSVTGQD